MLFTIDPRTGGSAAIGADATTTSEVDAIARLAGSAASVLRSWPRARLAELLDALAAAVEKDRAALVAAALAETGLPEARLNGEVTRCAVQFALFAEAVRDGGHLEAMIDHAAETALGPAPDVRRMLVPLGPVAVFGASNFPFAFSVLGGDTAAAVAAGCPVVLKAHTSHLLTSRQSFEVLQSAALEVGAPDGTFGIVYGQQAGADLLRHPEVRAAGFTGSVGAARALMAAIDERPDPIPFFGELSSINPLVVSPGAAEVRAAEIAAGLFTSVTGSAGQLCTKPGVALLPAGPAGEAVVAALAEATSATQPQVLLNERIRDSFDEISGRLLAAGADLVAAGASADGTEGFRVAPTVLRTTAAELGPELAEECFGPLVVVATYDSVEEVRDAFTRLPGSLTATLHVESDEDELLAELLPTLEASAGRVVFNGYPTGVRVTWAQHHGGSWPATNTQHTSVGVTSVRRFLRPVAWQDAPEAALPEELRDGYRSIPRRVDGRLELAEN